MNELNGRQRLPGRAVMRSMAELGHDAVTLAELQAELLHREIRQWLRAAATPAILLIAAIAVALGCIPLLLLSLAFALVELAELSHAASLLIAALIGVAIAGASAVIGWSRLRNNCGSLRHSRLELQRNVRWIKQVLTHKASSPANRYGSRDD